MYTLEQTKMPGFKGQFNNEQWELVTKYFSASQGCGKKPMSHQEYLNKVNAKVNSLNLFQKALNKIGLDEDELKEIPPIRITGFIFNDAKAVTGQGNKYTNLYEVTYLMFSATEVYVYSYIVDMLSGSNREKCDEYFYKDIVNITTVDETKEFPVVKMGGCGGKTATTTKETISISQLQVVVPGDKLYCAIVPEFNTDLETKLKAVKAKIREKKS